MRSHTRLRGEPALALALLLGGWVGLRVAFWESPFPQAPVDLPEALLAKAVPFEEPVPDEPEAKRATASARAAAGPGEQAPSMSGPLPGPAPVRVDPLVPAAAPALPDALRPQPVPFVAPPITPAPAPPITQRLAAAHNMVMMAGLSGVPLRPELAQLLEKKDSPESTLPVPDPGEEGQP